MSKGKVGDAVLPVPSLSEERKKHAEVKPTNPHLRTHTTYPKVYMVAVGDLSEGFKFYGPFKDATLALDWALDNFKVGEGLQIHPMYHVRGVRGEVETKL